MCLKQEDISKLTFNDFKNLVFNPKQTEITDKYYNGFTFSKMLGVGLKHFYEILRKEGFVFKRADKRNLPYQEYINKKFMFVKTHELENIGLVPQIYFNHKFYDIIWKKIVFNHFDKKKCITIDDYVLLFKKEFLINVFKDKDLFFLIKWNKNSGIDEIFEKNKDILMKIFDERVLMISHTYKGKEIQQFVFHNLVDEADAENEFSDLIFIKK